MTILEAIKAENIRVECGNRWLYVDDVTGLFVVRTHRAYARQTTVLIETANEIEAVEVLIND